MHSGIEITRHLQCFPPPGRLLCHLPDNNGDVVKAVFLLDFFHLLLRGFVTGRIALDPLNSEGVVFVFLHALMDFAELLGYIGLFDQSVLLAQRVCVELCWLNGDRLWSLLNIIRGNETGTNADRERSQEDGEDGLELHVVVPIRALGH